MANFFATRFFYLLIEWLTYGFAFHSCGLLGQDCSTLLESIHYDVAGGENVDAVSAVVVVVAAVADADGGDGED